MSIASVIGGGPIESAPQIEVPSGEHGRAGLFATTHWSVVLAASHADAPQHTEALEKLCRAYWFPVYAYIRRRGHLPEDAQDLTQEFFSRLLAKEWLAGIEPGPSRFRSFLLTVAGRFLANEYDRATALKRGGGAVPVELADAERRFGADLALPETPGNAYDQHWALTVLDGALNCLRAEATANQRLRHLELLSPFLSREPVDGEYEVVAAQLNMAKGAVGVAVHRLRRRYRELVRAIIADTVADPTEVDEELRYLLEVLRG
jgi:RNA polymerase sigma factor (sigma-70 family)